MSESCLTVRVAVQECLAQAFRRPESIPIVILEGEPGDGRAALVFAAAASVRLEGTEVVLARLDLDGWEPESSSLWSAVLASLGMPGGEEAGSDAFRRALPTLVPAGGRLVLHVPDTLAVPDLLLEVLTAEVTAIPGLCLVLQTLPGELGRRALTAAPEGVRTARPEPLTTRELRSAIAAELGDDAWVFLRGIAAVPLPAAAVLFRFLAAAGLCGTAVPALPLLAAAGEPGEGVDSVLDALDQTFVERGILEDLEYGHPSFPGQPVYRFSSPLAARAARESLPETERERRAIELRDFLREAPGPTTRGASRMLVRLTPLPERGRAIQELAWWTGAEDAVAQEELLARAVATGRLDPDDLWQTFESCRDRWPAYRLLSLVDVYGRSPVSPFRIGELAAVRSLLLFDLERYAEAGATARSALQRLDQRGEEARLTVTCQALLGFIALEQGDAAAASEHLGAVAEAVAGAEPGAGAGSAGEVAELSRALRALRSRDVLREALAAALRVSRRLDGFEGRRSADLWTIFSDVFRAGGQLTVARLSLERSVALSRRLAAPSDPQLAIALKNLAELLRFLGDDPAEQAALEEALTIEIELYGEDAERIGALRGYLIDLLLRRHDFAAARAHLQRALESARRGGRGAGHPVVLLKHLGDISRQQGDPGAAAGYLAEALALEEAEYGQDDPRTTVLLKQLADLHRELRDRERVVDYRLRALRVEEGLYGPEDARLLPNLKILAAFVSRPEGGDNALAKTLNERVRSIEANLPA
jgi:tetratricopeptide (TPR) repeat protein